MISIPGSLSFDKLVMSTPAKSRECQIRIPRPIHSLTHSLTPPSTHLFVHWFVPSLTHSLIHSFIGFPIQSRLQIQLGVQSFYVECSYCYFWTYYLSSKSYCQSFYTCEVMEREGAGIRPRRETKAGLDRVKTPFIFHFGYYFLCSLDKASDKARRHFVLVTNSFFLISLIDRKQSYFLPQITRAKLGRKKYFFFPSAPAFLAARGARMTELRRRKRLLAVYLLDKVSIHTILKYFFNK